MSWIRCNMYRNTNYGYSFWTNAQSKHICTMLQNYKKMSHLNFLPLFAVPSILFSGKFAENHVAMVASIYNNFPYPDRKSPVHVLVNKMIFDSKVMEVKSQVQISHRFIPIRTGYKTSDLSSIMYPIQTEVLM